MMPFLTIVTRCCMRPIMLTNNVFSVIGQNDRDLEQIFVVDQDKKGVHWANVNLAQQASRIDGEWVYILDDDCKLTNPGFVTILKNAAKQKPGVIMVKSRRPQFKPHLLPKADVWGHADRLRASSCNCLCYIVRADLWRKHIHAFGRAGGGDWGFLEKLLFHKAKLVWVDEIVAETQQLGRGKLFETCKPSWFADFANCFGVELLDVSEDWRLQLYKWGTLPRKYRRSFEEKPQPKKSQVKKPRRSQGIAKPRAPRAPVKMYPRGAPREPVERGHVILSREGRGG